MASLRPAYLIHGDDHGRIGERRAALRALAELEGGAAGVEVLDEESATPAGAAAALATMTFAMGHRVVIADGVERWKEAEVTRDLAPTLASMPPDTTIAFFGRDEGRAAPPKALAKAVETAGGTVTAEKALRGGELARWVRTQAQSCGLALDADAARALVEHVGDRQARLRREIEVLALEHGEGARVSVHDIEARVARAGERKSWDLADALIARDRRKALTLMLELREQGEAVGALTYPLATKLRETADAATMLERGDPAGTVRDTLGGGPPWKVKKTVEAARNADPAASRTAVEELAELEAGTRSFDDLSPDTQLFRAITRVTR